MIHNSTRKRTLPDQATLDYFEDLMPSVLVNECGHIRLFGFVHLLSEHHVHFIVCESAVLLSAASYNQERYGKILDDHECILSHAELCDQWLCDKLQSHEDERYQFIYDKIDHVYICQSLRSVLG